MIAGVMEEEETCLGNSMWVITGGLPLLIGVTARRRRVPVNRCTRSLDHELGISDHFPSPPKANEYP